MDNWTVSDVTGHAGVIGQYLANAIISVKCNYFKVKIVVK